MKEYPSFGGKPIGATGTLYIEVEGVDALHDRLKSTVKIVMPIATQFYGMREFAIEDPDGYVLTFGSVRPRADLFVRLSLGATRSVGAIEQRRWRQEIRVRRPRRRRAERADTDCVSANRAMRS